MKLASKIFLGSALVMVVLVGVGILSLRAVGHLAAVNRDITMRALPTLGRAGAAHDAVLALVRLETRFLVLGDARYAALWDERAARVREDLAALRRLVRTAREQAVLDVAAGSFARYEAAVEEERPPCAACGGRLQRVDRARPRHLQGLVGDYTVQRAY